jgi:hypothetical protein
MKKEIVLAVMFGLLIGLAVAFGIWRTNQALNGNEKAGTSEASVSQNPDTSTGGVVESITLSSPDMFAVFDGPKIIIKGITSPNTPILAHSSSYDELVMSEESGNFEINFELSGGANDIDITAHNGSETNKKKLYLVYSSEFFEGLDKENPSTESSTVQERVNERVDILKNPPLSKIGIITDIAEETIQIRDVFEEIQQISLKKDSINIIKINSTSETQNYEDIAIGDFITAIGFKNGSNILDASRIIISSPIENKAKLLSGKVSKTNGRQVYVSENETDEILLKFPRSWKGPEISEIIENDNIIAVGDFDKDNNFIPRSIYLY